MPRNFSSQLNFCLLSLIFLLFTLVYLFTKNRFDILSVTPQSQPGTVFEGNLTATVTPVWDTIDGEGYQFRSPKRPVILDPKYDILKQLPLCEGEVRDGVEKQIELIKSEFITCMKPIVEQWRGRPNKMSLEWSDKVKVCDELQVFKNLEVVPFRNLHETKWAVLPKCKEEHILVTLGVGHDTVAEENLNRTLPDVKFFGADPIIEPNRQMYSAFGKFFPFAIGQKPGLSRFRVLPNQNQKTRKYVDEDVITIDLVYFLKGILNLKKIDFAWIDIEGGEFEFLDQLHLNGPLDKEGISICQFNLEVHSKFKPAGVQVYHDFIFKVLEEQRYVFLNNIRTESGVHRMFFINVEDRACVAKFF